MNFNKIQHFALSLLCIVALASCSGEDGIDGEVGPQGVPGMDGNANVIASEWIPSGFPSTDELTTFFTYEDSRINDSNASNAAILVYGRRTGFSGDVIVDPIPISFSDRTYFYELYVESNQIYFWGQSFDQSMALTFDDFDEFRFVIIPPGTTSTSLNSIFGTDTISYEDLVGYFEIN